MARNIKAAQRTPPHPNRLETIGTRFSTTARDRRNVELLRLLVDKSVSKMDIEASEMAAVASLSPGEERRGLRLQPSQSVASNQAQFSNWGVFLSCKFSSSVSGKPGFSPTHVWQWQRSLLNSKTQTYSKHSNYNTNYNLPTESAGHYGRGLKLRCYV
jgi:hypothetical protein